MDYTCSDFFVDIPRSQLSVITLYHHRTLGSPLLELYLTNSVFITRLLSLVFLGRCVLLRHYSYISNWNYIPSSKSMSLITLHHMRPVRFYFSFRFHASCALKERSYPTRSTFPPARYSLLSKSRTLENLLTVSSCYRLPPSRDSSIRHSRLPPPQSPAESSPVPPPPFVRCLHRQCSR